MARPKRFFFTGPARVIGDSRLTALDLRCLAVIALHDGMSGVKGTGGGCYAKHSTLADLVGTDVSNFSKSLSRLIGWGYVAREPQLMDKRRFTLRVVYDQSDSWRTDQVSPGSIVGEQTNDDAEIVGQLAKLEPEIVGDGDSENGRFSKQTGRHYIPLNGELDSAEAEELNSPKGRAFGFSEKNGGEPQAIQWALQPHLPRNFTSLSPGAQLQKFEAAFNTIGRDPGRLNSRERETFAQLLFGLSEDHSSDNAIANQAQRLWEEIAPF